MRLWCFVFDSNVWIAATITSGTSKDVVEEARVVGQVFVSPYILHEVDRVLARKIGANSQERLEVQHWMKSFSQLVEPRPRKKLDCPDPKDIPILELALEVRADLLITGDLQLLSLKKVQDILLIPPRLFWISLQKLV